MESKPSPGPARADDAAWPVSTAARQRAREADACMAADDWLYEAPRPAEVARLLATRPAAPSPLKKPAAAR